ncbi:HlyD family type I secretion periplasmic adaptor subunit [Desulfobacter vibrioformis]|uniref:HlyD family type I secretion periplasmic adaptor subunit n=1 Tax=Desulfobacter vibrioformis TaxID=34031 RepID=UPI00054F1428|nr:HlyD family type I secretion periplasmic adaptor subunit [Desulfobacter vibrioformis]
MNQETRIRRSTHLFLLLLILMCLSFFYWAFWFKLDIVSMADGEVVPSGKIKQVQHLEGGIIREIKVREGDGVSAGQALMILEQIRSDASLEEMAMRIDSLTVDIFRLKAQIQNDDQIPFPDEIRQQLPQLVTEANALFNAHKNSIQSTVNKLKTVIRQREQHIRTIQSQLKNKLDRLPLLEEEEALSEDLLKDNLTTRIKHIEVMRRKKEIEGSILNDRSSLKEAWHALKETQEKLNETIHQIREENTEELKQAQQDLKEFSVRVKKFQDTLERTVIRSPINGVLKKLYKVTRGGVVKPGDTLADIVPSEGRLIIEAHLDIADIGYIRRGQKVLLQLPSKDARKFQKLKGEVMIISPDTFTDQTGRTFYNVLIESEQNFFQADDQTYKLYPGMILMTYIHIGKRTVLEYLLDPYINTLSFSLQEK